MNKINAHNKNNTYGLFFLKFTFLLSLLGLLLSIVLTYFFKTQVYFYFTSYILICIITFFTFARGVNINLFGISRYVLTLFVYSIIVTGTLTFFNNKIISFFIFYKNTLIPIILFFYYLVKLNNMERTIYFLKIVVFGGVFFGIYISLEFINKALDLVPFINQLIYNYVVSSRHTSYAFYFDPRDFSIENVIRPLGLEINFTATGFFLASVFFLLVISGHRFIQKKYLLLSIVILYIGVLLSTSRQTILPMHFLLLILIFILNRKKKLFNNSLYKNISQNTRYVISLLGVIITSVLVYNLIIYQDFLTGVSGGTGSILSDDLNELPNILFQIISKYPINFFIGVGCWTPDYPSSYSYIQTINELHFLLDILYMMGLIGFIIYWSIFFTSIRKCWQAFKITRNNSDNHQDIYLSGVFIGVLFIFDIIHYAPMGLSTTFIIALIPLLSTLAQKEIVLNRTS